jgi:hypothetical protein
LSASPLSQNATGLPFHFIDSAQVKAQEIAEVSEFLTVRKNKQGAIVLSHSSNARDTGAGEAESLRHISAKQ